MNWDVIFGAADTQTTAVGYYNKFFESEKIEENFIKLRASKEKMINDIVVDTPDEKINYIVNNWVKQQMILCAETGRATGKGFRNQLRDYWAVAAFDPNLAKGKIIETLKFQYSDGECVRGWLQLDHHNYSDRPTWIAPTINAYIKETGDVDFLNIIVPYLDKGEDTVWEHIQTGLFITHDKQPSFCARII